MVKSEKMKKICVDQVNVRMSISFLVMKLIFSDLFTTLALMGMYYFFSSIHLLGLLLFNDPTWAFLILIVMTIIESAVTVYVVLEWTSEYYEISAYRIVHKKGVFFKKVDHHNMQNIKQVVIEQGFFGRLFNYGTLTIFDWRLNNCAELYAVHNPRRYLRILESLLPNVDEHQSSFGALDQDDDEELSA